MLLAVFVSGSLFKLILLVNLLVQPFPLILSHAEGQGVPDGAVIDFVAVAMGAFIGKSEFFDDPLRSQIMWSGADSHNLQI